MSVPTIAVFVGSLRKDSCNRKLAHALEKLAGDRARFQYVQIGDLPLYDQDFDADYPPQGTRLKDRARRRRGAVRDTRVQPVGARRAQERHRYRIAPVW